jgi:hypothetical protein
MLAHNKHSNHGKLFNEVIANQANCNFVSWVSIPSCFFSNWTSRAHVFQAHPLDWITQMCARYKYITIQYVNMIISIPLRYFK